MIINGFEIEKYNIHNLRDGEKYHTCPICSETRKKKTEKCFTAYWDTGMGKCSHCGEVIQLHEWKKKTDNQNYVMPEWQNSTKLSDKVVSYFEKRGISQFVLRLMKISESVEIMPDKSGWKEKNTIQFPYIRRGDVINVKYRSGDKNFKLYKQAEKIPYNIDNCIGNEIIYLVEGEIDALTLIECGFHNVTSPPNGFTNGSVNIDWLNNDVDIFLNAEKLVLCFDQDEPGQNGTREFIRRFGAHKCYTIDLNDCKDSNEYIQKYGKDKLIECLNDYNELPLENVTTVIDYKDRLKEFFLNGMPKGYVTDTLKNLDENFSVNTGQVVLVTGIPSHGKSEVVDQLTISYALNYDLKTAYASPENKPNELHHAKIFKKIIGYAPKENKHFGEKYKLCELFCHDHFYMIDFKGAYDLEGVLKKAEEMVVRKGIKILVIDPYNKVRYKGEVEAITGNRINDYTSKYLQLINEFAVNYDCLVILVAHPVKLQKENGKRVIPDFYDVKGGGEFYDMCHHGLVVYKDETFDLTLIKVLKVKFSHLGNNGGEGWFKYNVNNGRLNSIDGSPNESDGFKVNFDNTFWLEKSSKTEQKSLIYSNNDLVPENWYEKERRDINECPF